MKEAVLTFLFSPPGWLSVGAVAAGLEILLPGAFMIWLAVAAAGTALTVAILNVAPDGQLAAFALWIGIALAGSRRLKRLRPITSDDPALNRPTSRLLGQSAIVTQPIAGGRGRVKLGDGEWIADGPDAPAGARVLIEGADGAILKVRLDG
jgi:membrane protein implicated in regulation of membrane protease activity